MATYDRKYWIDFGDLGDKLDSILAQLTQIKTMGANMSAKLDALAAQVNTAVDKQQEAILLLGRLSAEIQSLQEDPAIIDGLNATLKSATDSLSAAITANTPAPPAP